jgi:hypothetical protein
MARHIMDTQLVLYIAASRMATAIMAVHMEVATMAITMVVHITIHHRNREEQLLAVPLVARLVDNKAGRLEQQLVLQQDPTERLSLQHCGRSDIFGFNG